jgi:uncharacterized membrane protein YfcA
MPPIDALLLFVACVAVASVIQNLTAFAFGLVLLGLVELMGIVPLADATNASMVLALANSLAFFWGHREPLPWKDVKHVLWASVVGVGAGLGMQVWLSANASQWLRLLLGLAVMLSAANLILARRVRVSPSPPATFALFGGLSGIFGGLFATSGPPIVYHMMRQPFDPLHIRRCLMLIFVVNNASRLLMVAGTGRFSQLSLILCCVSFPVAFAVTRICSRYSISRQRMIAIAGALLGATGLALVVSAARGAFHP